MSPRPDLLTLTTALAALAVTVMVGDPVSRAEPSYEDERLERVLEAHGLERVTDPEGRPIAKVHLVRHDVFLEDEVYHAAHRLGVCLIDGFENRLPQGRQQ